MLIVSPREYNDPNQKGKETKVKPEKTISFLNSKL